jgi:hypothetical protein
VNTDAALPVPASPMRPAMDAAPRALARIADACGRTYRDSLEFLDSAASWRGFGRVISGAEKHSGLPLRAAYFGSGNHAAYVRDLLFRESRVESEEPGLRAWQAGGWLDSRANEVDVVVADMPWPWHRLLRGRGHVEVPAWINQRMRLPPRWEDVLPQLRRSARGEDLRSIRKHRLTYRLVREEEAVRRFYEQMYVPHLKRRFGEAAYVEPEWKIRWCVDTGILMEILREGEPVAAQVLWGSRGALHFLWAGATGDAYGPHTRGIFPALYYYGILYAFESGFGEVDYCGTRASLGDGIFQMKRRWGAAVYDGWSRDTLFFGFRHLDGAGEALLTHNALVARSNGRLVGRMYCGAVPAAAEHVERAVQHYACTGVHEIRIYSRAKPEAAAFEAARAAGCVEIVDLSAEPDPAAAYGRR